MEELEIIRYTRIPGISLFLNTVDYRAAHFHSEWELLWVLENPLQVIQGQRSMLVPEGELVFFNPHSTHELRKVRDNCTFLCLQIQPTLFPVMENLSVDVFRVGEFMDTDKIKASLREAADCVFRRSPFFELRVVALVGEMLYRLLTSLPSHTMTAEELRNQDRRNSRQLRLRKFVDENFMHKIRLTDFARQEGCSVSYLSRFIKESLGETFQDYVNTTRFNYACKRMASGGVKMLDVCMESGFSDYRYFSRTFQEKCGMSPEQYCRSIGTSLPESTVVKHNLHSLERFYSPEQSLVLLERLTAKL